MTMMRTTVLLVAAIVLMAQKRWPSVQGSSLSHPSVLVLGSQLSRPSGKKQMQTLSQSTETNVDFLTINRNKVNHKSRVSCSLTILLHLQLPGFSFHHLSPAFLVNSLLGSFLCLTMENSLFCRFLSKSTRYEHEIPCTLVRNLHRTWLKHPYSKRIHTSLQEQTGEWQHLCTDDWFFMVLLPSFFG